MANTKRIGRGCLNSFYKTQFLLALGALNPNMTRGNDDDDREVESKTTGLRDHAVVADGVYNPQPPPLCHVTCSDYAIAIIVIVIAITVIAFALIIIAIVIFTIAIIYIDEFVHLHCYSHHNHHRQRCDSCFVTGGQSSRKCTVPESPHPSSSALTFSPFSI